VVLAIAFTVYATLKNVYDDDDDGMVLEGSRCPGGDKYIYTRDDGPQRSWLDSG